METAIPPKEEAPRAFFWMAVVKIYYTVDGGQLKDREVNVLSKTHNPFVNQNTIGNIQQSAQIQASQLKKLPRKAKIEDVVISGPWMIGHMTDAEFQEAQPSQVYVTDAPEEDSNGKSA